MSHTGPFKKVCLFNIFCDLFVGFPVAEIKMYVSYFPDTNVVKFLLEKGLVVYSKVSIIPN